MKLFVKKRWPLVLIASLAVFAFLFWKPICSGGAFLLLPTPDTCSLCNQEPREVPCLLNRNTGDVGPLVGTAVPGKFQFVGCLGAMGGWDSDTQTAQVTIPHTQEGLNLAYFCRSCRFQLAEYQGDTFVLLDLSQPEKPVIYPLKEGAEYTILGWLVSIQTSPEQGGFDLVVTPARHR